MVHMVFVHGTGVREPVFTETFEAVRAGLKQAIPSVTVYPCYWAGTCGSNIGEGRSIPLYDQAMAVDADMLRDDDLSEWALLLEDPFLELRLLASQGGGDDGSPGLSPAHVLRQQFSNFQAQTRSLKFNWLDMSSSQALLDSLSKVLAMPEFDAAILAGVRLESGGADGLDPVRMMAARTIVAAWTVELLDLQKLAPLSETRNKLVGQAYEALGGGKTQTLGLGGNLRSLVLAPMKAMLRHAVFNPSLRLAAWGGRRYRHTIANATSPAAGDILLYQARGKPIRDFILATAEAVKEPVVLVAHSLGGIACIDLLIERAPPCIKGVITAGSQAPFLYEIGALTQRARDVTMPAHMPPWLNFYDKNDLLSFLAAPVMTGAGNAVTDVEVSSGQPFPASHSAYWSNPAVWKASAKFISALSL